jgi:hypothetical protein
MATKLVALTRASLANSQNPAANWRPFEQITWEVVRPTWSGASTLNNNSKFEVCRTPPLLKQHETAIVDSGCPVHFLLVNASCLNKVKSQNLLTVRLPNGATMESSHTAELDIPELNAAASKANVFPGMANHSLLSVGKLCDEGSTVTFKQAEVTICDSGNSQILSGPRDLNTGL